MPVVRKVQKFEPLSTYKNFEFFWEKLINHTSKQAPSLLALQALTHSKPILAKEIFERAVMEPFWRIVLGEFPSIKRISPEGSRRVEELQSMFLQKPIFVMSMLEAIFVIERVEPWARDTVKLMGRGKTTLEEVRKKNTPFASHIESNGCALGQLNLGCYVRERNYRIMLELVSAIDGRSVEEQAKRILADLPVLSAHWDAFGEGTTDSMIGPDGAKKIVSWIMGHIEF